MTRTRRVSPHLASAVLLSGLAAAPVAIASVPHQAGDGGTVGHVAYVTADNKVDVVTVRASGKTIGETTIGPVTKASPKRQIRIYGFVASGDGSWVAWEEVVTKPDGDGTAATPTLVLRGLDPNRVFEIKTSDFPVGFAGDTLITSGGHTHQVILKPSAHLEKVPRTDFPEATYPDGTVTVKPLRSPPGPNNTQQLRLTTLSGKSMVLHDYVMDPQNPRLPETAYVSGDGNALLVERGDHTDFGGIGPTSLVDRYSLSGGHKRTPIGHYGTNKAAWRVGDASFAYKDDEPWVLWERADGNGADSVIAVFDHGEWQKILNHGIAVAGNHDGYVIAQAGKYVFDSDGLGVTRVPKGDALLLHGVTTRVTGISGSAFAWVN